MTQEQTGLIFELTRRKLEAELAAAEEESKLRWELMVKESEARVAAAVAAATASASGGGLSLRRGQRRRRMISPVRSPPRS